MLLDGRKHVHAQPDVYADVSDWLHSRTNQDVCAVSSRKVYEFVRPVRAVRSSIEINTRIIVVCLHANPDNRKHGIRMECHHKCV